MRLVCEMGEGDNPRFAGAAAVGARQASWCVGTGWSLRPCCGVGFGGGGAGVGGPQPPPGGPEWVDPSKQQAKSLPHRQTGCPCVVETTEKNATLSLFALA